MNYIKKRNCFFSHFLNHYTLLFINYCCKLLLHVTALYEEESETES